MDAAVSDKVNIRDDISVAECFDSKDDLQIQGTGKVRDLDSSVVKRVNKSRKKGGFCAYDLVWGKVRSHPWWPAQIFEPDDASEQAKKHYRSKSYLVAYFGDQTFAWNDEAKLKPFAPHFSQMAKQSSAEAFRHAVDCALDEAARRAEFGLSCHCIADDVYSKLKVQVVKNAGIREKSHIQKGGDILYTASSFEPVKFLDYVKNLAQVPHLKDRVGLEHVVAHAQMSAFYRWKGCYHLAEFGTLRGYVNNEADAPDSRKKEEKNQVTSDETVDPQEQMEEDDVKPKKRKKLSGISGNSTKKVKRLSDSLCRKRQKCSSKRYDDEETEGKDRKFSSSSVGRHKEAKLSFDESKSQGSSPQITPSRESKLGLRVGESIMRAALQLSQPSPLLKLDVSSHKKTTKSNGKSKQHPREIEADPLKNSSLDAILSKFLVAAVDPLKEHSFLSSMITFFSNFRDSIVQSKESPPGSETEEMAEGCSSGSKSEEFGDGCEITTSTGFKSVEDASCAGKISDVPEVQTSLSDEEMVTIEPKPAKADGISSASLKIDSSVSGSQQHCASENVASESGPSDEDNLQDESPTALTLKFTDMDSIPTVAKLNKIFSAFGQLKESETEVLPKKNCARVVFKRRLDAETAFSSSGKFETFGASLVCYRLNYAPSPRKSPSPEAKRRRKDGTVVEGIAA
ncbi:hypothetical protein RND81_05G044500 [Saponaria officinalis]